MVHDKLQEHASNATIIRRRAEAKIDKQFIPLRKVLEQYVADDRQRLQSGQPAFPDNSSFRHDRLEPRVCDAVERLLHNRIAVYRQALSHSEVQGLCTSYFVVYRHDLSAICGNGTPTESEITGLINSCASGVLAAFRLSDVMFSAYSSCSDGETYVTLSVPTFP